MCLRYRSDCSTFLRISSSCFCSSGVNLGPSVFAAALGSFELVAGAGFEPVGALAVASVLAGGALALVAVGGGFATGCDGF